MRRCRYLNLALLLVPPWAWGCASMEPVALAHANKILREDLARARGESTVGAPPAAAPAVGVPAPSAEAKLAADSSSQPRADRVLIYSADLRMVVADVETSLAAVQKLGEDSEGYLVKMTSEQVVIRVPAPRFREVLDRLKTLGQTIHKNIEATDVTDEYTDLKLQLRNAEALMNRLSEILTKSQNVKDTLEIERELNRVRTEIERLKGRIAHLDRLITFSTITVTFTKATEPVVIRHRPESAFPWVDRLGVESVLRIRERQE